MKAKAYQLGFKIDPVEAKKLFPEAPVKKDGSFSLFKINEGSFVYLKRFGGVVFINVDLNEEKRIIGALNPFKELDDFKFSEDYEILVVENAEVQVDYTTITVPYLNNDVAHIISLNLAETVVLDHYQQTAEGLLKSINTITKGLRDLGRITIGRKKMRKFIGRTLLLKNQILENLYIFESPDLVWDDELLASIDNKMREQLEIIDRHHSLQHNLDVITENLDYFKDILQHRHSSTLEWVIILLIFIEIVQLIIERIV